VDARRSTVRIQIALLGGLVSLFVACSTIGTSFHSDTATLSHLVVGKTTPEEAAGILGSQPYIRQNLPNGTIAWQWQSIKAGALVGVTDNRLLVLQFKRSNDETAWRFFRVLHSQNVDLPPGMPFGSAVN
jgi:hypothetical protein